MDVKKNAKDVYLLSEDDLCNRECHQSTDPNQDHYYCPLHHVCDLKCINWQTSLLDKKWSRKNCFVCAVSANINYKVDSSILVTFQSCEILISLDNFFFWPLMLLHLILLFSWTLLSSIFWFFLSVAFLSVSYLYALFHKFYSFSSIVAGPREARNPNLDSDQWIVYYACVPRL